MDVNCFGNFGCRSAEIITSDGGSVYSYGRYSTSQSKLFSQKIYAGGYRSLVFATIDSNDNDELTVTIDGRYTGYGAIVICRSGSICNLNCGQTGCLGLNYICMSGAECNIKPTRCGSAQVINYGDGIVDGTACPEWKISSSLIQDNEIMDYIDNLNVEWENDNVYNEERNDFQSWQQVIESGRSDKNEDIEENNSIKEGVNNVVIGMLIAVLLVSNFLTYSYLKYKYRDSTYKPISNPRVIHFN